MKKILKLFLFVMAVLVMPVVANAAEVDVTDEASLKAALNNVSEDVVVNIKNEIKVTSKVPVTGKGIVTINGNGFKVYADKNVTDRIFELTAVDGEENHLNVTFNNIVIENNYNNGSRGGRGIDTRTDNITLTVVDSVLKCTNIHNNQPITIGGSDTGVTTVVVRNSNLDAGVAGYAIISFVKTNLTIEKSNLTGYSALYMQAGSNGTVINVKDSSLVSNNNTNDESNRFATIFLSDENISVNIVDSKVEANGTGDAYQSAFSNVYGYGEYETPNTIKVSGDKSVIKIKNKAEVEDQIDSTTGESLTNTTAFTFISTGLDITFEPGVTTDVVVADNKVETIPNDYLPSDAVVEEKEDGTLTVVVKRAIKTNTTKHGKFSVDRTEAIVGQIIKVLTTPDVDYELDTIKVVDADGKEVAVNEDGTFVMPDSEVTVTVSFKENVNPDTSDNILSYFMMGIVSLAVVAGVTLKIKKAMN